MSTQIVWHYTTEELLDAIVESRLLRLSQWEKQAKFPHPALWFSAEPEWEPTATKIAVDDKGEATPLTREQQFELSGAGRIGMKLQNPLISWQQYKRASELHPQIIAQIEQVSREKGANPALWHASFRSIPEASWHAVELWDGEKWVSYWEE